MCFKKFIVGLLFIARTFTKINACPQVPQTCVRELISFYLYTSPTVEPYALVLDDGNTLRNAPYLPNTNFKVIIHGYTGNRTHPEVLVQMRDEYFKQKPWNVIVVDWGPLAKDGCYFDTAANSVSIVGRCCSDLLKAIFLNKPEIKPEHFHVIGFSLGAQICASLGVNLRPIVLPRITGLDPALPDFTLGIAKGDEILNREHAQFVDAYHTNMAEYGVLFSNAHYDIYANGGTVQPGCDILDFSCSHHRAPCIFTESINSQLKFIARKCDHHWKFVSLRVCDGDHKIRMEIGEHCVPPTDESLTGTYQFDTRSAPPFAMGPPEP